MTLRQVRRRCEQIARGIRVPDPFDLDTFISDFGADRGRPVHLIAFDLPPGAPCGLCVSTDAADYLVVTSAATGVQRVHIALHELAHLLLEHRLHLVDEVQGSRQLFRHLDPGVVRAMFARTNYSSQEEQEAETLASLLGQRAGLWRPPAPRTPSDPVVERLGQSLEH
ncbi:hypothetical protein [Plantactinospora sp. ZYX-F-223]|uniref:hypothetical protein n=1 Tax=Plantactinospora sp. ZYX-F-223 TaxID=3144103 RepID=UPI0031FBF9AC